MAYYYLKDEDDNTLTLDDKVMELSLGGNKRNIKIEKYAGSHGGYRKGQGNYEPKKFKVTRIEYAEAGDATPWNSRRNDFAIFFTKNVNKYVWLYQVDGEGANTMRTRVYCTETPSMKISNLKTSDDGDYELISEDGLWTSTVAVTDSDSITSDSEQSVVVNNTGIIDCDPTFTFTPTSAETSFQIKRSEEFKIRVDGSFLAGIEIALNMENGKMYINDTEVNIANYLINGSPFPLDAGSNTLYVKCSGAGTFGWSYYPRWI